MANEQPLIPALRAKNWKSVDDTLKLKEIHQKLEKGKSLSPAERKLLDRIETYGDESDDENMIVSNQVKVAAFYNVHRRTVSRWIKDGMPSTSDGKYNLLEILHWLNRPGNEAKVTKLDTRFQFRYESEDEPGEGDKKDLKYWIRINRMYVALIKELEFHERKGKLLPREEIIAAFALRLDAVKKKLLAMPRSLGGLLAVEEDAKKCESLIEREVKDILHEFRTEPLSNHERFNELSKRVLKEIEKQENETGII